MLLHFGTVPVLVASSADAARDVLKTHDRVFASRPHSKIYDKLLYGSSNMASAPYGEYWRQMKSVSVIHLLSNKMVRTFREVRQEEITTTLTNDVICRVALGQKYGAGTDFKELIDRLMRQLGTFTFGSYVPSLAWIDWICGLERKLEKTANDFDTLLEKIVQDHEDGAGDKADFADVLLGVQRDVMINLFAVGREVATWGPDADEFKPERHLNSSADFRGQDFELIPFGAGRRMCPGTSFAVVLNEVALANLMLGFDWKSTEDQTKTDVPESIGAVIRRMNPLYVIASPAT
ncbi:hypothetical protein F2Q69_00035760 [Brassica cretica]|uniref:Uncharacterized protein n=1 Tax=Brassica cretica TaxID=69181 RepID=A0A8S9SK63_BRACR|nr:hypothetical protein F2Q69_00035760 [Brassica cretica]